MSFEIFHGQEVSLFCFLHKTVKVHICFLAPSAGITEVWYLCGEFQTAVFAGQSVYDTQFTKSFNRKANLHQFFSFLT